MDEQGDELRVMGIRAASKESETIYGLTVPAWFTTTLYKPGVSYSVDVHVRVDPEAGPVPEGVRVNANREDGLTYKDAVNLLKGAPVDQLLHDAMLMSARSLAWNTAREAMGKPAGNPLTQEESTAVAQMAEGSLAAALGSVPAPVRRRSVTRDLLREVAQVYRSALTAGAHPTQAVASHFTVTHSSAARWVREARKAGELGPSQGPVPGEAERPTSSNGQNSSAPTASE